MERDIEENTGRPDVETKAYYVLEEDPPLDDPGRYRVVEDRCGTGLVFSGLFAGIVSAFVLESRKKLRMDDQELLLQSIHNALRGLPPQEDNYKPATEHLWINGLWFSSLVITLFSAIVGVLAKSWLVKYASLPMREEAEDAYQRWAVDQRVRKWRMERVNTMIQLLVQLAFFLFAIGLALQCFNDHQVLGGIISGLVGVGTVTYLLVTSLPLFIHDGSCPVYTPFSEILVYLGRLFNLFWWKAGLRTGLPSDFDIKKGDHEQVLATIWCDHLIKSPKDEYVDEAVAEVARTHLSSRVLQAFADADTAGISLRRLESCMSPRYEGNPARNEIISGHLLALSRFIGYLDHNEHRGLRSTLAYSVYMGGPLSRWNYFTEPLLPLVFCVRVSILLTFGRDISLDEVAEEPWEQLARSLQPRYRIRFLLVSCRALAVGGDNLRKLSSRVLTSCMGLVMRSGYKSDWRGMTPTTREVASDLVRLCIVRLFNEIVNAWGRDALEYWSAYSSTGSIQAALDDIQSSEFPRSLNAAFKHPKAKYRRQAVDIIFRVVEMGGPHNDSARRSFPDVFDMAVSDEDFDVRQAATQFLALTAPAALKQKLSKLCDGSSQRFSNQQNLVEFLEYLLNDGFVSEDIHNLAVAGLVKLAFSGSASTTQSKATDLSSRTLIGKSFLQRAGEIIRRQFLEDLRGATRADAFRNLHRLWSQCSNPGSQFFTGHLFRMIVRRPLAHHLVTHALVDLDKDVRQLGRVTLLNLLSHVDLPADSREALLQLLKDALAAKRGILLLKSRIRTNIQLQAIEFVRKYCVEPRFDKFVTDMVPSIIKLALASSFDKDDASDDFGNHYGDDEEVEDTDFDSQDRDDNNLDDNDSDDNAIQVAAITLLDKLVANDYYSSAVVTAFPADLGAFRVLSDKPQTHFISLLSKFILRDEARRDQCLKYIVQLIVNSDDKVVHDAGMKTLISLCGSTYLLDSLKAALPTRISSVYEKEHLEDSVAESLEGLKASQHRMEMLLYLIRNESLRNACSAILQSSMNEGVHNQIWELHIERTESDNVYAVLASLASKHDVEGFVRSASMNTLHYMAQAQDDRQAWKIFQGLADNGFIEPDPDIFLNYLNLLATTPAEYEFTELLFNLVSVLAAKPGLYGQGMDALKVLGRRDANAQTILEAFRPHLALMNAAPWWAREKYAELLGTMVNPGDLSDSISQLMVMGTNDQDDKVRQASLDSLTKLSGQPGQITLMTPILNALDTVGLGKSLSPISIISSWREQAAWASLLSALSLHTGFDRGRQKLIDLVVEDDNEDVRREAYKGLSGLSAKSDLEQDNLISSALEAGFTMALRDSNQQRRSRAVSNLHSDCFSQKLYSLRPAQDQIHPGNKDGSASHAILTEVGSIIPSLTDDNKTVVLGLIESVPEDTSNAMVSPLATKALELLSDSHGSTRCTALGILGILHKKGIVKELIQSSASEVLAVALEDSMDQNRSAALSLLMDLCSDPTSLSKITTALPHLLGLLQNAHLRTTTAELISLLAKDEYVRRSLANWVISIISGTDLDSHVEGVMALLSTLSIERRLSNEPQGSDIVLFFAPALVPLRDSRSKLRDRVTALLWCNYRQMAERGLSYDHQMPALLMDTFIAAVFGHHVTMHEVDMWMSIGDVIKPHTSRSMEGY
ncbi:armadillo-type protein [Coprinopsis sp. MPI-PUGE-AT-0042]|nr:armadillo-type protein [Coprinopsis sp. MPI-PUGE-AT-0042]